MRNLLHLPNARTLIPGLALLVAVVILGSRLVGWADAGGPSEEDEASTFPTVNATRPVEPTPFAVPPARSLCNEAAGLCELAQTAAAELSRGDAAALIEAARPYEVVCSPTIERAPLCDGRDSGAIVDGFNIAAFAKPARLVSPDEFAEALVGLSRESNIQPIAVGCQQDSREAQAPDCGAYQAVALSVTGNVVVVFFRAVEGSPSAFALYFGGPLEFERAVATGGHGGVAGVLPDGSVGLGMYYEPLK